MLTVNKQDAKASPIMNHGPVHSPVMPIAELVFCDNHVIGAEVSAAISFMNHWRRERIKITILPKGLILFARGIFDQVRLYGMLHAFYDQFLEFRDRGLFRIWMPENNACLFEVRGDVAQDSETFGIAFNLLK